MMGWLDFLFRRKASKAREIVTPAVTVPPTDERTAEFTVLADRLQAEGDPFGQRIALYLALARATPKSPEYEKLAKELAQFEKEHAEHFFGSALLELMRRRGFEEVARLTWEYGYIVRARIGAPHFDFEGPNPQQVIATLMRSPAGEHLRELTIGLIDLESGGLARAHEAIAEGIVHPHLETMHIGDFRREQQEISWVEHGDVGKWFGKVPNLRTLRLRGAGISFGEPLGHRKLARLEIETGGLPEATVASLAKADLPELTHLTVWLGTEGYGGTTNIEALRPLFSSSTLPKLQHLGLQNSDMQDQIAIELAQSPLLSAVSSVDMSMGTMREPGAQAILDNAARFEHLRSLNLDRNFIPVDQCDELRRVFGSIVEIGRQATPDVYNGDIYYYTAVGE